MRGALELIFIVERAKNTIKSESINRDLRVSGSCVQPLILVMAISFFSSNKKKWFALRNEARTSSALAQTVTTSEGWQNFWHVFGAKVYNDSHNLWQLIKCLLAPFQSSSLQLFLISLCFGAICANCVKAKIYPRWANFAIPWPRLACHEAPVDAVLAIFNSPWHSAHGKANSNMEENWINTSPAL